MKRNSDIQGSIRSLFFHTYVTTLLSDKKESSPGKYPDHIFTRNNKGDVSNSDLDNTSSFTGDDLFSGFEIEGDRFFDIFLRLFDRFTLRYTAGE